VASVESIRAVRREVSASIADCKAALAKTGGDVKAAIVDESGEPVGAGEE